MGALGSSCLVLPYSSFDDRCFEHCGTSHSAVNSAIASDAATAPPTRMIRPDRRCCGEAPAGASGTPMASPMTPAKNAAYDTITYGIVDSGPGQRSDSIMCAPTKYSGKT